MKYTIKLVILSCLFVSCSMTPEQKENYRIRMEDMEFEYKNCRLPDVWVGYPGHRPKRPKGHCQKRGYIYDD